VLGVAIGVMVLNIVMAVMTGFESELKSKLTDTNSHIIVRSIGGKISNWQNLSSSISEVEGVESISPVLQQQALFRTASKSSGIIVRGIDPTSSSAQQIRDYIKTALPEVDVFSQIELDKKVEGASDLPDSISVPGMVIGLELARQFALSVGDMVSVLTPQVASSPFGLVPRFRRFVVSGIYSSGLVEYESGLVYVGLPEAQRFFNFGDAVSTLELRVRDLDNTTGIAEKISEITQSSVTGLYVQDWKESNQALWDALQLEKKVYFIVLLLIVVMASFSIITTLIMLVLEKRKDIAVLRTLGASSSAVSKIFLTQGAVIGFLGTTLGLILGLLGCVALREYGFPLDQKIFQMSELPVKIETINFVITGICSFVICCLATIYPSRRASKVMPSEALRY
jgi:lipoprotein-releasing system permease protein